MGGGAVFLDLFEEKLMGFDIYGLWVKNRKKKKERSLLLSI